MNSTSETVTEHLGAYSASAGAADFLAGRTKEELLEELSQAIADGRIAELREHAEAIKTAFYKLRRSEVEAAHRAFIEEGGAEADFVAPQDAQEARLKDLLAEYRRQRDALTAAEDKQRAANLAAKQQIIEELKELASTEAIERQTFTALRALQERWKATGAVPQAESRELWENYHLQMERFYEIIKIDRELRDMDLKRNLEAKTALIAEADALAAAEIAPVAALEKLQKLHDQWREIGPVPKEVKDELWERFKASSTVINKRHQAFFEGIKATQNENLSKKQALCEQVETMLLKPATTLKAWEKASETLIDLQKQWRSIGFAPRKENNAIYERFRAAADRFFESKRAFYGQMKGDMEANLAAKIALCEAAEALQESTDWRKTADELVALQAKWKQTGAVSRRHADAVWKRFRAACDHFFEARKAAGVETEGQYGENLRRKEALLAEMAAADASSGFEVIREFQRRWGEIGFVPGRQKEAIQKRYKEEMDRLFETLRGAERGQYRQRIGGLSKSGQGTERERLYNKVRQIESEITQLENNIGFFARSKGAEQLIAGVQAQIDKARRQREELVEKVKMLDKEAK